MHEYLFRGLKLGTEEFVYGDLSNKGERTFIVVENPACHVGAREEVEVLPGSVGMFTGEVVKVGPSKGHKIFVGDILQLECGGPWMWPSDTHTIRGPVEFCESGFFVMDDKRKKGVPVFQEINWWNLHGNIHTDKQSNN